MTGRGAHLVWAATILALTLVPAAARAAAVQGTFKATAVDYPNGVEATLYRVVSEGESTPIEPLGEVSAKPGDIVKVKGRWEDGALEGKVTTVVEAAPTPTRAEEGTRTLAVIITSYADKPAEMTAEEVREIVFTGAGSANAFYRFETYGKIAFRGILNPEGDVFGPYLVSGSKNECPPYAAEEQLKKAAELDGAQLKQYQHVYEVFPRSPGCDIPYAAAAGIYGRSATAWGYWGPGTYAHELGHNLGFYHAHSLECMDGDGKPVPLELTSETSRCKSVEYGDQYDVMGGAGLGANNWRYLESLGVLTAANVQTVRNSNIYTMQASSSDVSQVHVLRVPAEPLSEGEAKRWYYLEIRPGGLPFESPFEGQHGVAIRRVSGPQWSSTELIDMNPATAGTIDAPLAPGRSFKGGTVGIETLSAANGTATVAITTPERFAPEPPAYIQGQATSQGLEISWPPGNDDVGVAGYRLYRDGAELSGAGPAATSYLDTNGTYGTHTYAVATEDAAHNTSAKAKAQLAYPDLVAPSAPSNLKGVSSSSGLKLSWSASTDNAGVTAYKIFRDGAEIESVKGTTTSYHDTSGTYGTHTYTVTAEDAADHVSGQATAQLFFPDVVAPTEPSNVQADVVGTSVELSWGVSFDNVATARYSVFRDGQRIGGTSGLSYVDPAPSSGAHEYAVYAEDNVGNRSPGGVALVSYPDLIAPSQPNGLRALLGGSEIVLSWSASTDDVGVVRYVVLRDEQTIGSGDKRVFVDSDPSPGTREYTVYAEDGAGNVSDRATPVSLTVAGSGTPIEPSAQPVIVFEHLPGGGRSTVLIVRVRNMPDIQSLELRVDGKRLSRGKTATLRTRWTPPPDSPAQHRAVVWVHALEGRRLARTFRFRLPAGRSHRRQTRAWLTWLPAAF